jgi:hypothetical protein
MFIYSTSFGPVLGAHPVSYTVGTGGSCLGVKGPGREAVHSFLSNTEVKNR